MPKLLPAPKPPLRPEAANRTRVPSAQPRASIPAVITSQDPSPEPLSTTTISPAIPFMAR